MSNLEVAKLLRAVAAAYEVKPGDHRFQRIAYERAADAVEHASSEVKDLWDDGKLEDVAGIGKAIAEHLDELFRTGKVKHFENLMKGMPPAMFELLEVPGIGARSAHRLTKELGIKNAENAQERLLRAAEEGKIRELEGFGEKSEEEIIEAIKEVKARTRRLLLPYATGIAEEVVLWLKRNPEAKKVEPLGSLRRQVSTVGDIDIACATNKPKAVIDHFTKYPKKVKLIEAGEATSSILLPGGVQVDLMVQPVESFGALLQHFTGSKHHNIALRSLAQKKGLSLSEYGIKKKGKLEKIATEEEFYKMLGMEWIPPELREDEGEIEAAQQRKLPKLVDVEDIKGDFHIHSDFPPETSHDTGKNSMEDYVKQAENLRYEYIAFSEHNLKSSLSEKRTIELLKRKKDKVEQLNYSRERKGENRVKRIFNSLEVDILPDGRLALPEKAFDLFDFIIASVHSSFRGTKQKQTERILRALGHPKVRIFGHPTGRMLNRREGIDLNWEKVLDYCKSHNKWLEVNSWPERLDLPDVLVRQAVKNGVKLVVDTDSHAVDHMKGIRYGIAVARRGWATKGDIVNTLPYNQFEKQLKA